MIGVLGVGGASILLPFEPGIARASASPVSPSFDDAPARIVTPEVTPAPRMDGQLFHQVLRGLAEGRAVMGTVVQEISTATGELLGTFLAGAKSFASNSGDGPGGRSPRLQGRR